MSARASLLNFWNYLRVEFEFIFKELLKWFYTWGLASIPIVFGIFRNEWEYGHIEEFEICKTGEIFLVAIVMVAEPLGPLMMAKQRNNKTFFMAIMAIMCIMLFGYAYALLEFGREHEGKFHKGQIEAAIPQIDQSRNIYHGYGPYLQTPWPGFDTTYLNGSVCVKSEQNSCKMGIGMCFVCDPECKDRVVGASYTAIICAFIIGLTSVLLAHVNNAKDQESVKIDSTKYMEQLVQLLNKKS